jgi:hypothetical protein
VPIPLDTSGEARMPVNTIAGSAFETAFGVSR